MQNAVHLLYSLSRRDKTMIIVTCAKPTDIAATFEALEIRDRQKKKSAPLLIEEDIVSFRTDLFPTNSLFVQRHSQQLGLKADHRLSIASNRLKRPPPPTSITSLNIYGTLQSTILTTFMHRSLQCQPLVLAIYTREKSLLLVHRGGAPLFYVVCPSFFVLNPTILFRAVCVIVTRVIRRLLCCVHLLSCCYRVNFFVTVSSFYDYARFPRHRSM